MPLIKTNLVNGLRKFMDEKYSAFDKFPETEQAAISALADAVDKYASAIMPASATASAAKSAMIGAMTGMGGYEKAMSKIQDGFTQYVTVLGSGMAGYTATPPSGKVAIKPAGDLGLNNGSSEDVAKAIADIVDTWFKTGIAATQTSPPVTVPWS